MGKNICITFAVSLMILAFPVNSDAKTFDLTTYGAKADGSDISQALTKAWNESCSSTEASTIVIPKGTYALTKAELEGPCNAPIEFQLQGTLQAPSSLSQTNFQTWFTFQYIDHLTVSGGGTFDGQGSEAWQKNTCSKDPKCPQLPYNLAFNFVNNTVIQNVTSLNSKNFHVNVLGCNNITFSGFNVTAPGDSPNTDGIHIGRSKIVNVTDTTISTGDDCISIGDGAEQVGITRVTCGPGHGISVGSLGKYENEAPVVGIYVKNCTLINTSNGVRIKTWPNSYEGVVSEIHAEDIIVQNVSYPVVVDQEYCPWNHCQLQNPSKVKLTKASFKNIRGTSMTAETVKLDCSKAAPCEEIEVADIDLQYVGTLPGPAKSTCSNVKPTISGTQNPQLCTEPAVALNAQSGQAA